MLGVLCGIVMSMGCASPLVADPVASCSPRCSRAFAECVASGKQNQRHSRRVQARGTAEQHLPQRSSTANRDVWAAAGLRLQNLLSTVGCGASQTASTSFADIDERRNLGPYLVRSWARRHRWSRLEPLSRSPAISMHPWGGEPPLHAAYTVIIWFACPCASRKLAPAKPPSPSHAGCVSIDTLLT